MAIAKIELNDPAVATKSAPISAMYDTAIIPPTELGTSGAAGADRTRSTSTGSGARVVVPNHATAASSTGWRPSNVSGS